MKNKKTITQAQVQELMQILEARFEKHKERHKEIKWSDVALKLNGNTEKLWSLYQMEITEGEPDVIGIDDKTSEILFCDCAAESPKGRRSLCYDEAALNSRKANKPENSAMALANEMGIELMNETQYTTLQNLGKFDTKTSSWLLTPKSIRELGGAIFGDFRFGRVFIYHNGAESYYGARAFRGILKV